MQNYVVDEEISRQNQCVIAFQSQITALQCVPLENSSKYLVLAASGPWIRNWKMQNGVSEKKNTIKHVLGPGTRIHGIRWNQCQSDLVYAFGAKEICCLKMIKDELSPLWHWKCNDWIVDVLIIPNEICILTAHNRVLLFDISLKTINKSIACEDQCVLYSGKLFGNDWNNVVIASGTLWQGVLYWRVKDAVNNVSPIKRTLKHHGAVFALSFLSRPDGLYLVSGGEDRLIQVWQPEKTYLPKFKDVWGHTGRIWQITTFFKDRFLVLSVGEEAEGRIWDFDGEEPSCLAVLQRHAMSDVWSCAVDPNMQHVLTGGGAGGVCLWNLSMIQSPNVSLLVETKEHVKNFYTLVKDLPWTLYSTIRGNVWLKRGNNVEWLYQDLSLNQLSRIHGHNFENFTVFVVASLSTVKLLKWTSDGLISSTLPFTSTHRISDVFVFSKHVFIATDSGTLSRYEMDWNTLECSQITFDTNDTAGSVVNNGVEYDNYHMFTTWQGGILVIYPDDTKFFRLSDWPLRQVVVVKQEPLTIATGGRDGFVSFYTFDEAPVLESRRKVTKGDVEGLMIHQDNLYALCFFGNDFYILNYDTSIQVFGCDCGGKNRKWCLDMSSSLVFDFIKSQNLWRSQDVFKQNQVVDLLPQMHGMRINSVLLLKNHCLTASEDTTIIVSSIQGEDVIPVEQYRNHSSAVRVLHRRGDFIWSGGGNGQVFQWKWNEDSLLLDQQLFGFDPNVRVMTISSLDNFVIAGASDGTLLVWNLVGKIVDKLDFNTCINSIITHNQFIVIGGTNGKLTCFEWKNQLAKPVEFQTPCSVDCMSLVPNSHAFTVHTGGNDGGYRQYQFNGEWKCSSQQFSHASQIVDIKSTSSTFTLSLDQRLIQWPDTVYLCTVADVTCMDVQDEIVIAGMGLEILRLK